MRESVVSQIDAFLENSDPKTDILRRRLYENIKNDCRVPDRKASTELIRVFDRLTESDQLYVLAALPHMLQLEKMVFNKALRESERGSRYHGSLVEYAKVCLQEPATMNRIYEAAAQQVAEQTGQQQGNSFGKNLWAATGGRVIQGVKNTVKTVGNNIVGAVASAAGDNTTAKQAGQANADIKNQQDASAKARQKATQSMQKTSQSKEEKKGQKAEAQNIEQTLSEMPQAKALIDQINKLGLTKFQETTVDQFIRLREKKQNISWQNVEAWMKKPGDPDLFEAAKTEITNNKANAPKNAKKIEQIEKLLPKVEAEISGESKENNNEQNNNSSSTVSGNNDSSDSSSGDNSSASNESNSGSGQPVDAAKFAKIFGLPDNVANIIMSKITQHGGKLDKLSAIKESANRVALRCWKYL